MVGVAAAALAAYGVFLIWSSAALGWRGIGFGPSVGRVGRRRPGDWRRQAGLGDLPLHQLAGGVAAVALLGGLGGYLLFGSPVPAAITAGFSAAFPWALFRSRRARRLEQARDAWPRMLEELRLATGPLGRSIPQALFDVGRRAPAEMRSGFSAAEREWLLTTDFDRTVDLLKRRLADPTADAICETLVVAHHIGGGGLERRLTALAEDRLDDVRARKDAGAKASGVRFARRFVLIVPLGMALAGLSIGPGRAAYQTTGGQAAVAAGLLSVIVCWVWSGRLLRLPEEPRVFGPTSDRQEGR
jgi:tight adherence protein B